MSVKIVRLITGEELIADVKGDAADDGWLETYKIPVNLDTPAILVPHQNKETGQTSIQLVPWIPYVELTEGISINPASIMYIETPCIDLVNVYNQQFGSGLVIPTSAGKVKKIITGPTLA